MIYRRIYRRKKPDLIKEKIQYKGGFKMREMFNDLIAGSPYWTEIRYHYRHLIGINIKNGKVHKAESKILAGAGVRCLVDGC